jgi:hypothetical protein
MGNKWLGKILIVHSYKMSLLIIVVFAYKIRDFWREDEKLNINHCIELN